jgi:cyanuric acid amidohydrolase
MTRSADGWTTCDVLRLPMRDPGDASALVERIEAGELDAGDVVAVISQTEGTGHARGYATLALGRALGRYLEVEPETVADRIPLMMIGLCGGLMSPHHNVVVRRAVAAPDDPPTDLRLAVGVASTPPIPPAALGRAAQAHLVADAVRAAIADGGLAPDAVRCVEIKCPAFGAARAAEAEAAGVTPAGATAAATSSLSKGASALGIAMALGEVDEREVSDAAINHRHDLWTARGSVSAGEEQRAARVLVLGNRLRSTSPLRIGASIMSDQLDVDGALAALRDAGLDATLPLAEPERRRVRQVFVNCGADLTHAVRGRRHTMHSDFLAGYASIMAKVVANAIVGALVGDPMVLASAGAEHQGPPGANLVAALVEVP